MNWDGVKGATEHRTTGTRAWCHQDSTWCYPHALCQCCYHADEQHEVCPTCEGEGYIRVVQSAPMSKEAQIRAIIEKHLDLDTVHIEYHRESIDMVGHMVREIMQLHDT